MSPDALAALHARCFETPRPWSAAEFEYLLTRAFLLTSDAGFLLGRVVADEAELLTLAVAPEVRRGGQGRALVDQFLDEAAQRGAVTSFLEVSAENAPARALYRAAGFEEVGLRAGYYLAPDLGKIDAVVMRRDLRT
ncbi:ribosomal-protein-alanine N-acetyltransferase [Litoreibacter ponti]|uniref:Ribosomal-protein-alanine N-acetyltransferase n=1 Tax=Litoreibacter ponti TaxID=1510457 RepID=A0A2T6BM23_9RHOB|nr:GNAT family N-acetyltransferase [Litoreibacter ponti]PTX57133.1 ribosomal-protein-alanine N-acetyltransferase [Litoreibacter ponti]